jgi:SAM-dependent methyltransferase
MFRNAEESHAHSLQTLNTLFEYDDFMESINTVVDLGCGSGLDLEWWATRTTRDDSPIPLNIQCTGVDQSDRLSLTQKYSNIRYQQTNFENNISVKKSALYDVLWCHDSFQYAINPLETLKHWWNIAADGAMLALIIPQTTNFQQRQSVFSQASGCYYHHTVVSLIHMLAVSGWDCRSGFFLKNPADSWLHAIVYKSNVPPMNPQTTTWYDLVDHKLLPESADQCVLKHGELRQQELLVPWIDKSLMHLGQQ